MLHFFKEKYIKINFKNKRLLFNSILSFTIMGLSYGISFLLLPAYMNFFSEQKILGLWFTAMAVLSWVLTFDLGIGNGLRNNLVEAFANNDEAKTRKYIASAYILIGSIVITFSLIGYVIFTFVNWNEVFNISNDLIHGGQLLKMVRIIFIGIMLQFFLRLITSILYALQIAFLPNLLAFLSNLLLLLFIVFMERKSSEENIIILAYANVITANLPILIATIILFSKKLRYAIPSFKNYDIQSAKNILKLGGVFFWIQIMYLMITNTNEFLISWSTGVENVVDFKIYNSLFSVLSGLFILTLTPMWSEVTEAHVKNDVVWIKKLYKRLNILGLIGIIGLILLVFFLQFLVDIWLQEKTIKIDYFYASMFVMSTIFFVWYSILSTIVGGIGKLKILTIFITLGAFLNFPLTILFTKLTHSWIGVIIANILSLLPLCIALSIWINRFFSNHQKEFQIKGKVI